MSLLSLEKYLYAPGTATSHGAPRVAAEVTPAVTGYYDFSTRILQIVRRALMGQALADIAAEIDTLRGSLDPHSQPEALVVSAQRFDELFGEFQDRLKRADQERAEEFRKVLTTLKQTFAQLSSGGQTSDSRFHRLEASLRETSQVEDLETLQTRLQQVLRFARQESFSDQRQRSVVLSSIGDRIQKSTVTAASASGLLESREAALFSIGTALMRNEASSDVYVKVFVADLLKRLVTLHGPDLADSLLSEFSSKSLGSIALENKVFRWSTNSVLHFWRGEKDTENYQKAEASPKGLFEYQAFLGDRVASFRVGIRSLSLLVRGSVEEITNSLDQFAQ